MPVWYERTKEHVAAGRLAVLGITEEQHPARCRLFAQWRGIDWPILWDPFNLTGSKAVPTFTLVDAHGVVRVLRARPQDLEPFLAASHDAPVAGDAPAAAAVDARLVAPGLDPASSEATALAALLYDGPDRHDAALARLAQAPDAADGTRHFRLGVAHRIRYDGPASTGGDFADALGHWSEALRERPDQYIWRRRIQQYGPRPDKPYPFYDWVERARAEIAVRGDTPVVLPVALTETERNAWRAATANAREPDPDDRVAPAEGDPVARIESAVAWTTADAPRAARVHLRVVLTDPSRAAFSAREQVVGWVRAPRGDGWDVAPRRLGSAVRPGATDDEAADTPVSLEFEVTAGPGAKPARVEGYVLLPICLAVDGRCLVVRESFVVPVSPPPR